MPPIARKPIDPVQKERQRCLAILEAHRSHFAKSRAFQRVLNAIKHGDDPRPQKNS